MIKYFFRVFKEDDLVISAIVPQEAVFSWIDKYKDEGLIKCHIVQDESEVK